MSGLSSALARELGLLGYRIPVTAPTALTSFNASTLGGVRTFHLPEYDGPYKYFGPDTRVIWTTAGGRQ